MWLKEHLVTKTHPNYFTTCGSKNAKIPNNKELTTWHAYHAFTIKNPYICM